MNIYLLDTHPLIREAMSIQIRRIQPTVKIFEASDLATFANLVANDARPGFICSDMDLPDSSGLATIKQLKNLYPHSPLFVFTAASAALFEDAAISAGADAFVQKTATVFDIAAALRALLSPDSTLDTQMGIIKLSKRQKQLMIMLHEGLSNQAIAHRMDISEHTVKVHLWRLFRKLDVHSRTQALAIGRANGLI
jgi:DNA-binding NarL/FixJ family response regulator